MNDKRKRFSGKLVKISLLLITSMLIATASASVLNSMYMQASPISAETAKVQFVTAADSTEAGATVGTNGTYVMLNSLGGWPNSTRTSPAAVRIENLDTRRHTFG